MSELSRTQSLQHRNKAVWTQADFSEIARRMEASAEQFVARLGIQPGIKLLDLACGTGNQSLPAARLGAQVTGLDIAPNLLVQARTRAAQARLNIEFVEGNTEELSFPDASFDMVITMFGAMFAPQPELVAHEMARVCKPGGKIAMANWTPEGFAGRLFKLTAEHVPPPPDVPPAVLWGDEKVVRARLGKYFRNITCSRQLARFDYEFPPAGVVDLFRKHLGPTQLAFSRLDASGQQALAHDLEQLWKSENRSTDPGRAVWDGEYLEVVAQR